jgi:hypothetical protein
LKIEIMAEKTLGEKRVKIDFNTTNDSLVDNIKKRCAELIDLFEEMRGDDCSDEKARVISKAQDDVEQASMWGVKGNFTE